MSHGELQPTPQEELLMAMHQGEFGVAVDGVARVLAAGGSPSMLAVVRPETYIGFAEQWLANPDSAAIDRPNARTAYKNDLFRPHLLAAAGGDMAALSALPKFVTSGAQLTIAAAITLDNREALARHREDTRYLQCLGSFDPQHVGHRVAIGATTEAVMAEGRKAHALVHVMGDHPRKVFDAPYAQRYVQSERRIYQSPWLSQEDVTQVDVPGGKGLAARGLSQMALLAEVTGDRGIRWVIGSDKLLLDVDMVQTQPDKAEKAAARFDDPRMDIDVVHRQNDDGEA
ncbi:MAG TPA: hypothetical protein VLF62_05550, partial [Candidatus Saccharimonadales bacterium]|nr:hypothetical protein [Candidatus Saccharimonadales bacterium]